MRTRFGLSDLIVLDLWSLFQCLQWLSLVALVLFGGLS